MYLAKQISIQLPLFLWYRKNIHYENLRRIFAYPEICSKYRIRIPWKQVNDFSIEAAGGKRIAFHFRERLLVLIPRPEGTDYCMVFKASSSSSEMIAALLDPANAVHSIGSH